MLKKLTQQATDLMLHSIASGEVMGANLLITKGNEELVYAQAGMAGPGSGKTNRTEYYFPVIFHDKTDYSSGGNDSDGKRNA